MNVIIADGLKGSDYGEVEINGKHVKAAKIGKAVFDSDIVISVNHFKGHEEAGFGGVLKNLGMGCGSRGGKLEMHSSSKPVIVGRNCKSCGICGKNCANDAISFNKDKKAVIDYSKCTGCGQCIAMCMYSGASLDWNEASEVLCEKIAEYTWAVVKGKPCFHISFMMDISPNWPVGPIKTAHRTDIGHRGSFDLKHLTGHVLYGACRNVLKGSVLKKTKSSVNAPNLSPSLRRYT
jgi:uncharacterized Fe-S center protein